MPYYKDPYFSQFLEDEWKIWRYVDFDKFVDLLVRQKQYFVSGDKLMKIDPYEGYFLKSVVFFGEWDDRGKQLVDSIEKTVKHEQPKNLFVNCWHINESESDAMWKLYAKGNGIAIQTTVKKLKNSFSNFNQKVIIAKVRYVEDYEDDRKRTDLFYRFSAKRKSFKHEDELRILTEGKYNHQQYVPDSTGTTLGITTIPHNERMRIEDDENGMYVKVNLSDFIEHVYVSPLSAKWFEDLVKSITKKYDLPSDIVKKSTLYDNPEPTRTTD